MRLDYISRSAEDIKKDFPDSDPFEMAKAMGNLLLFQAMGKAKSACKGFFMMQDGQPSITINSDLPKMIQKIICAHELGHAVLHIMPQNPNLSNEWKRELGPEWSRIHETWLHTIGNLTISGYNSEYSDKPFIQKRDMENGFRDSPIRFNQSLRHVEVWDEQAIINRAQTLSELALQVWAEPRLPEDTLVKYRPRSTERSSYTIDDYPSLSPASHSFSIEVRQLYDALRKEILSIDPVVIEEYLKLYIAFKAETNFVDVVPQSKRLRLALNLRFEDIYDPKGKCKDVTNLGRWGNGDVEVFFAGIEDMPYIMSLIRQSFDYQMNGSISE